MSRTNAQKIQMSIAIRIGKLEKFNIPKQKHHLAYLRKQTGEIYELAKEAGKLKEIKKIIERKN